MRERNVAEMKKNGRVVLLTAHPQTILDRVKDSDDRPLLNGHKNVEYIEQLMEARREKYEAAADIVVDTDNILKKCIGKAVVDWYLTLTIHWFRMEHRQMREQSVFLTGCAASGLIHA